ncbi:hypothetical protein D3C81_1410270 [compost metagenome]
MVGQEKRIVYPRPYRTTQHCFTVVHSGPHPIQKRAPHIADARVGRKLKAVVRIDMDIFIKGNWSFEIPVFIGACRSGIMVVGNFQFTIIRIRSPLAENTWPRGIHLFDHLARPFKILFVFE